MKEMTLAEEAANVLAVSLDGRATVAGGDGHVIITLNREDFQRHLGDVLQHASIIVERAFPSRAEDIYLLIRDKEGARQQQLCLRRTSEN